MHSRLSKLTINCVTYGCGTAFDRSMFIEPKNGYLSIKPFGGLWGSPVISVHSWKDWCLAEDSNIESLRESFEWQFKGNAIVIDTKHDLEKLTWTSHEIVASFQSIDFEAMRANGVDGIHLTANGEPSTRLLFGKHLYGWDCETVLALNPDSILPA